MSLRGQKWRKRAKRAKITPPLILALKRKNFTYKYINFIFIFDALKKKINKNSNKSAGRIGFLQKIGLASFSKAPNRKGRISKIFDAF